MFLFRPSGAQFEIPVLPPKISLSDGATYTRQVSLGSGPTGFPGYRTVQSLSWESFFPWQYDSGYCQYANLLLPIECVNFFQRTLNGTQTVGRPDLLHFKMTEEIETGQIWPLVDDSFVLENFDWNREAGDMVDITYAIHLKTLKIPSLKITDAQADVVPRQLRAPVYVPPGTRLDGPVVGAVTGPNRSVYIVKSGDSLSSIAASQLSDMSRWKEIYTLNISTIGPDPDFITVGMSLTMPGGSSLVTTASGARAGNF